MLFVQEAGRMKIPGLVSLLLERMVQMLQQLVNGLILGSVYALWLLVILWCMELSNDSNFAHGDIYMVGAFMGYFLLNSLKG